MPQSPMRHSTGLLDSFFKILIFCSWRVFFFFMLMFFLQYCIKILFILKLEHFCAFFFFLSLLCDHHSFVHLILSSILRARSSFFQMRKVWLRDYRDLWCDGFCPRESNPEVRIQDDRSFCLHQGPHI